MMVVWLLCGVVCYLILRNKGYNVEICLLHGILGTFLGLIWVVVALMKKPIVSYGGLRLEDIQVLEKLADLKRKGYISEVEYASKKDKILLGAKTIKTKSVAYKFKLSKLAVCFFAIMAILWMTYFRMTPWECIYYFFKYFGDSIPSMGIAYALFAVILFVNKGYIWLLIPILQTCIYQLGYFNSNSTEGTIYHAAVIVGLCSPALLLVMVLISEVKACARFKVVTQKFWWLPGTSRFIWYVLYEGVYMRSNLTDVIEYGDLFPVIFLLEFLAYYLVGYVVAYSNERDQNPVQE